MRYPCVHWNHLYFTLMDDGLARVCWCRTSGLQKYKICKLGLPYVSSQKGHCVGNMYFQCVQPNRSAMYILYSRVEWALRISGGGVYFNQVLVIFILGLCRVSLFFTWSNFASHFCAVVSIYCVFHWALRDGE